MTTKNNGKSRHGHDVIVIGASAGGVEALPRLIGSLPKDLPAAVFVVIHLAGGGPGMMPVIIGRATELPVRSATDRKKFFPGEVYVAPPDHHLTLEGPVMRVLHGPRENRHRPAIDPLFRSAALAYGARVIGVVLTGFLDDGTAGLNSIKAHGGVTVVQDPEEAMAPGMPRSALEHVVVDHCVHLAEMAPLLVQLAETAARSRKHNGKVEMKKPTVPPSVMNKRFGSPTAIVCPECNGPLWETGPKNILQFRCHVGHAFSADSLVEDQADALERALWSAVRTFDERAMLLRRLAQRRVRPSSIGKDLNEQALQHEKNARVIRRLLEKNSRNQGMVRAGAGFL
jgi:two-component system chemotaxis response regulator CheB